MKRKIAFLLAALCALPGGVAAQQMGAAVRLGTLGLGAEAGVRVAPKLNVRAGISGLTYSFDATEGDIDYEFDLKLFSAAALVDWHALGGGFRLSGGLLLNNNKLDALAVPGEDEYEIGGNFYPSEEVGRFTGTIDFAALAPYVGLGWGDIAGDRQGLGLVVDVGVLFQGSPDVLLETRGANPLIEEQLREDLKKEQEELSDDLDAFGVYPVLSLGLRYRF